MAVVKEIRLLKALPLELYDLEIHKSDITEFLQFLGTQPEFL